MIRALGIDPRLTTDELDVNLSLDFEACGEARPRVVRTKSGRSFAYSPKGPKRTKLRMLLKDAYKGKPLIGALGVSITCWYEMPQSWSKARKAREIFHGKPTKPDIDNVLKFILDAGNGILWEDDNQIVAVVINKLYGAKSSISIEIMNYGDRGCK